jgi:hypothetical protein
MKRFARWGIIWLAALCSLGMGEIGGHPEGTVPETDLKVSAKIVDRSGVETGLEQFSMNGKSYLDAQRGSGQLTIPFPELAAIEFGSVSGDLVTVQAKLKSGESMELEVRRRSLFYGSTGYGAFVIKARDVSRIEFP